jgi:hypothetical protein
VSFDEQVVLNLRGKPKNEEDNQQESNDLQD